MGGGWEEDLASRFNQTHICMHACNSSEGTHRHAQDKSTHNTMADGFLSLMLHDSPVLMHTITLLLLNFLASKF